MSGAFEPDGLDWWRVVQVLTTRGTGSGSRGSGYQVARDVVLTAAHVVGDATSVQVRFLTRNGGTRVLHGERLWADSAADIALLRIADDPSGTAGSSAAQVSPVRYGHVVRPVDCRALGFPRFKLRPDTEASDLGAPVTYRDSHHARGDADPLSNHRRRSLEITVRTPPEYDPEPGRSPWEGMSGAAVWSGGCLVGVISEHHRSDGLSRLAASPVDRWYADLTPARIGELNSLIGLPPDAGRLVRLPRSSPRSSPGSSPSGGGTARELRERAERLADRVALQWQEEERRRNLHHPFPLAVCFRNAATTSEPWASEHRASGHWVSDHWASIRNAPAGEDPGPLTLSGRLGQIVEVYRSIPSRRLVVLGAAGSGKSVLTLRFVLDWLADRAPGDLIPVIFGLGSWDTGISLRAWMCRQLERDYGLAAPAPDGGNLAGALVDKGWILPVLDGFDEIAMGLRSAALDQLSRSTTPLLLTSRRAEYVEAVEKHGVLSKAAVVELDDLTLDDLADYLPRTAPPGSDGGLHGTVWEPVLAALREQPRSPAAENVAMVLATPLMVAMARTVYSTPRGCEGPEKLLDAAEFATPEDLQKHLLAEFTPAAYKPSPADDVGDRGTGRRCERRWNPDPGRAQHWLGYLADHLATLGTRDLAWWQLGTAMRRSSRMLIIGFLAALAFGVTTGVGRVLEDLVATSLGLRFALLRGLVTGLLHGLAVGLVFGLVYGFVTRGAAEPSRVRVQIFGSAREGRTSVVPRFKFGLMYGASAALVLLFLDRIVIDSLGLSDGLDGGLVGGLVFVPGLGLATGLTVALMAWLEVPIPIRSAFSSSALLSQDRRNVAFYLLVWALVFGVPAGVVNGLLYGPEFGLLTALAFGLEAAFGGGLGYGLSMTAWGQWVALSRIWLPLTGQLPWRLVAFLDDACDRGVLRQAGAVYQFRHARLQDQLAEVFLARGGQRPAGSR